MEICKIENGYIVEYKRMIEGIEEKIEVYFQEKVDAIDFISNLLA